MINPEDFVPKTLDDCVIGNPRSRMTLNNLISGAMPFPAFGRHGILLYGAWGTGKTTLANLIPEAMEIARGGNDAHFRFIASGGRAAGAVGIANQLESMWFVSRNRSHLQYMILDEVDNLTELAQGQLKASMDLPDCVFILTTNHIANIDKGIMNRCHPIEMNAAAPSDWMPLMNRIFAKCNIATPPQELLFPVIESANGSARAIISGAVQIAIQTTILCNQPSVPPSP